MTTCIIRFTVRVFRERLSFLCPSFPFGCDGRVWDLIVLIPDHCFSNSGWSGGAKVLGKLPVPGRPTNLDYSRARACCACSRCGWGLFGHFFFHLSFLSSFSHSLGDGPI